MVFDSLKNRAGGHDELSPMQIAHHTLFTSKEKIALLHQLKSNVVGANSEGADLGFEPSAIEEAIAEVRR